MPAVAAWRLEWRKGGDSFQSAGLELPTSQRLLVEQGAGGGDVMVMTLLTAVGERRRYCGGSRWEKVILSWI